MFTYGFYNSKNGDRKYNATHFGKIFDGVIQDGVFSAAPEPLNSMFKVEPAENQDGATPQCVVNPGKAWFMHTWNILDSKLTFSLSAVNPNRKRTDVIVIEVNANYDEEEYTSRTNDIKVIEGDPVSAGSSMNVPELKQVWNTNNTEKRLWQFPIAYITVYGSNINGGNTENTYYANKITANCIQSRINVSGETDTNKYKTWTPLVTGSTMNTDLNDYIPQWNGVFDKFMETDQATFNSWFAKISTSIEGRFVSANVEEGFLDILTYYEKDGAQYIPTSDTSPVEGKTYYVFDTSSSIVALNNQLDNKILYGTDPVPEELLPGQVYFQYEE